MTGAAKWDAFVRACAAVFTRPSVLALLLPGFVLGAITWRTSAAHPLSGPDTVAAR